VIVLSTPSAALSDTYWYITAVPELARIALRSEVSVKPLRHFRIFLERLIRSATPAPKPSPATVTASLALQFAHVILEDAGVPFDASLVLALNQMTTIRSQRFAAIARSCISENGDLRSMLYQTL
jgi:hypothetical protein